MTSLFKVGRAFEDKVHKQFVALQDRGLLKILGRNVRLPDKDGILREIDLLIQLFGPLHSVNVCIECRKRKAVKIEIIDRIRALRFTLPHTNFLIISSGNVSGPTMRAAEADNIPIILYKDLELLTSQVTGAGTLSEHQGVTPFDGWKFVVGASGEDPLFCTLKALIPNWTKSLWPYLVTSKTQLGNLMFHWICDVNDLDWHRILRIASDNADMDLA